MMADPKGRAGQLLGNLWSKTEDGTATPLEVESLAVVRELCDAMTRMEHRVTSARNHIDVANDCLGGDWG
ncbi:MAG: hypothetical protein M3011_00280 [Actinomycetota bacterium]|nr:hypothetical protein [Actinomycetota bacterium]